nr:hypothetical protein [Tanacetum cinerariifolium]
MTQEIVHIDVNSVDILNVNKSCVDECNTCMELKTELLKKKDFIEKDVYDKLVKSYSTLEKHYISLELQIQLNQEIFQKDISAFKNELRKLKGKNVVDTAVLKPIATIAPGMFKLDIELISHRLKNNRDAHEELLVYVSKTCPSLMKPCEKLVAVTPINMDKKVRFVEPVTYSSNILKQTDSLKTKDSNKPLLTSTRVNTTTSASGSKPSKKLRILRPPSINQKNKVEEHPRKVKSSFNKMNFVSEPISNAHVKHSVRNAKFESICAICNKFLFDANHDICLIDFVNDVNVRSKSKSKRNKMRKVWKSTGSNNSSGTKKYQRSNSSDGGNTGDGVKIVGRVIGSCGGIGDVVAWRTSMAKKRKVVIVKVLTLFSIAMALEKVLVITALKEQLNKLKGKAVLTEAVSLNPIDPALLQVDIAPLVPKLRKNMTAHSDYIRHTQEEAAFQPTLLTRSIQPPIRLAATLREIVESERLLSPLNTFQVIAY